MDTVGRDRPPTIRLNDLRDLDEEALTAARREARKGRSTDEQPSFCLEQHEKAIDALHASESQKVASCRSCGSYRTAP